MCSSCGSLAHSQLLTERQNPVVVLVGRTNVGKSTLFTRIAGVHRKMGNWPATTVEIGSAEIEIDSRNLTLLDVPGIASLSPISPDEALTIELLENGKPDVVVFLIDAASMARCLYLLSELLEINSNVVIALTMDDVAQRRGIEISVEKLSQLTFLPVVKVNPRKNQGIETLEAEILKAALSPNTMSKLPTFSNIEARVDWVHQLSSQISTKRIVKESKSDQIDKVLIGKVSGPLSLLLVLWCVFQGTTTVAVPVQDLLDRLINGNLASLVAGAIGNEGIFQRLILDGVIAGVGTLLTFLPIMTIMFFFLSFLEDSGYMARAAVVSDRLMRIAGLPGKAILPMLVGFGCNVPAISATRSLSDSRHRLIAGLAVPFTACSARLAVYVFVGSIFFGKYAGTVVFVMYILSILLVIIFSILFRLIFVKDSPREPLLIELPPYKMPTSALVVADAWIRVKGFLREAGGIVVITVIAVWALMAIPVNGGFSFGDVPVEKSAYGALANTLSPIFTPAGFGDWHTTGALIAGFVAKEVVISSWAQNYSLDQVSGSDQNEDLGALLLDDFKKSSDGHTYPAIWAFLIFLTAYTPCIATVGAQKREFGTRWALIGIALQLAIAWVLAVVVFQVGKLFA